MGLLGAALLPWEMIGSSGVRNFVLCKKQKQRTDDVPKAVRPRKAAGAGIWKAWFTKSRSLKISSH